MSQGNLNSLLGGAGLSQAATSQMLLTADTMGPAINAGLGTLGLDDITTSEVVIAKLLLDDSGSIRMQAGNAQAMRDGHNMVIDVLKQAKQAASVVIGCSYLNDGVFYPFSLLDDAILLNSKNYNPNGGTPLFDASAQALVETTAKLAEFEQGGIAARAITCIASDGGDYHSRSETAATVKKMVDDLLRTEQHIVCAIGFDDGYTDFKRVFGDMGIPDEWILTPKNTPSEIRRAFAVVSQSAVRVSQTSAATFSATAMGGFGTP